MKKIAVIIVLSSLFSCSKIIPAKFWQDFHSDLILTKDSDQGPFGGTAEIIWKNDNQKIIKSDVLKFADENGWILKDSLILKGEFSLEHESNYPIELIKQFNLVNSDFKNGIIYIYETGMIKFKADTEFSTQNNGFVLINENNYRIKMFNIWED